MGTVHALIRSLRRAVRLALMPRSARAPRPTTGAPPVRPLSTHRDDTPIAAALLQWHARLNAERFGGALREIPVRVSRRMRSRLGHYAPAQRGAKPEIAISHRHVRRHGLAQAIETSSGTATMRQVLATARTFQLSAYDALYLDIARVEQLPLATLDHALRAAAPRAGVELLS